MKAVRENDRIVLRCSPLEARLLRRVFATIARHYEVKPAEIHPSIAAVWYSTRGCASARMTDEQTREWVETLHNLKSANVALLRKWRQAIAPRPNAVAQLDLPDEESHVLLTVINDHRLMRAARYDIGDFEMSVRTLAALQNLKPRQRAALLDITFLAGIIEAVLALLPGNYGDWPMYA
ncbi:MAG TPA: hypothetical protein VK615_01635 [Candidatus Binatia bacterium]|nr:hypothetical protein [Candidatus Binatia bacterium]